MDASSMEARKGSSPRDRRVRVSAYVELGLDEVLGRFAPPRGGELLVSAIRAALGGPDGVLVEASAGTAVWVSSMHAQVPVTWCVTEPSGLVTKGEAALSLLKVQSGHDAITELLVSVRRSDATTDPSTAVLHEVLHTITSHLEAHAPSRGA